MTHFFICPVCENDILDQPGELVSCDDCRTNFKKYTLAEFVMRNGVQVDFHLMDYQQEKAISAFKSNLLADANQELHECKRSVTELQRRVSELTDESDWSGDDE